jgi:hypothetical protein
VDLLEKLARPLQPEMMSEHVAKVLPLPVQERCLDHRWTYDGDELFDELHVRLVGGVTRLAGEGPSREPVRDALVQEEAHLPPGRSAHRVQGLVHDCVDARAGPDVERLDTCPRGVHEPGHALGSVSRDPLVLGLKSGVRVVHAHHVLHRAWAPEQPREELENLAMALGGRRTAVLAPLRTCRQ